MAQFIGNYDDMKELIGTYCENKVNDITRAARAAEKNICQFCGGKSELETADTNSKEARIKDLLDENFRVEDDSYVVDLLKFDKLFAEKLNLTMGDFHFLCRNCHRKYVNNEISDTQIIERRIEVLKEKLEHAKFGYESVAAKPTRLENGLLLGSVCNKLGKDNAAALCRKNNLNITINLTYAAKNKSIDEYWANPPKTILEQNWWMMLDDYINRKLYVFLIPAKRLSIPPLRTRLSKSDYIDLGINYGDREFEDKRSRVKFVQFLIKSIGY